MSIHRSDYEEILAFIRSASMATPYESSIDDVSSIAVQQRSGECLFSASFNFKFPNIFCLSSLRGRQIYKQMIALRFICHFTPFSILLFAVVVFVIINEKVREQSIANVNCEVMWSCDIMHFFFIFILYLNLNQDNFCVTVKLFMWWIKRQKYVHIVLIDRRIGFSSFVAHFYSPKFILYSLQWIKALLTV